MYEIILVDNNCTDDTFQLVDKMNPIEAKNNIMVVKCSEKGAYASRNLGSKYANPNAEILAFTDSDCIVHEKWLERMNSSFNNLTVDAVQGPGNKTKQNNPRVEVECFAREMTYESFWGDTKNFAIRKKVFDEIGGFSTFYTGSDSLFVEELRFNGYRLYFNPGMVVYHVFPEGWVKLIKKNWKHGIGDVHIELSGYGVNRGKRIKKYYHDIISNLKKVLKVNCGNLKKLHMILFLVVSYSTRLFSYLVHSLLYRGSFDGGKLKHRQRQSNMNYKVLHEVRYGDTTATEKERV